MTTEEIKNQIEENNAKIEELKRKAELLRDKIFCKMVDNGIYLREHASYSDKRAMVKERHRILANKPTEEEKKFVSLLTEKL